MVTWLGNKNIFLENNRPCCEDGHASLCLGSVMNQSGMDPTSYPVSTAIGSSPLVTLQKMSGDKSGRFEISAVVKSKIVPPVKQGWQ